MRQFENDSEHIWLRQSVTFSVNGQTRTVEIAIPVHPTATPESVETLLDIAEAGMERLSRRLDARVAALTAESPAVSAPAPATAAPTAAGVLRSAPAASTSPAPQPASESTPREPTPGTPPPASAAGPRPPAPPARNAPPPAAEQPRPAPSVPARPAGPPARPAAEPAASRARPSGPIAAAGAAGDTSAPDISRPEFLTAATDLGLNAKQAMDRLGVRSLAGLNLREALEMLRRQMVRGGESAPATDESPARTAPPAAPSSPAVPPSVPAAAPPPVRPLAFDEEDDEFEMTFSLDGDDALHDDFGAELAGYESPSASVATPPEDDDLDAFDLPDVPDHIASPLPVAPVPAAPAPAGRNTSRREAAQPAGVPPETSIAAPTIASRAHALELIEQLRSVRGGGTPAAQQMTAYRNIVARELGETKANALVRGLWQVPPDRLGAEQLDALNSWGKRDTFSDDAALVLAALRAERERAADASPEAKPAPQRPAARGRASSTHRSDTAGGR